MNEFENDWLNDDSWNEEIIEDLLPLDYKSIVVYSRDWTIDTIFNQIKQGNIELNPKFQRRNAWTDEKRSKLIESLLLGLPVPEIVLAEDPYKKKSFIVIDGKQRLLTIAGFIDPVNIAYWKKNRLSNLRQAQDLNGKSYEDFVTDVTLQDIKREFDNADIRCTVISNFKNPDILYDIFYRVNTGSVPLSTQELRQVLNKGPFADYLYEITLTPQPIHKVMKLKGSDPRLRDIEIILRFLSICYFGEEYKGNLKNFLDDSMLKFTIEWDIWEGKINSLYDHFNESIEKLSQVFGVENVGRKFVNGRYDNRFNRVLFEVQAYYFMYITDVEIDTFKESLRSNFEKLSEENMTFRSSLESSTKNIAQYRSRYLLFRDYLNSTLKKDIQAMPIPLA